MYSYTVPF